MKRIHCSLLVVTLPFEAISSRKPDGLKTNPVIHPLPCTTHRI